MENLYSTLQGDQDKERKNGAHRLLRRLRLILLFLLISFIITIIWFTNSLAF